MDDFLRKMKRPITDEDIVKTYKSVQEKIKKFGHTTNASVDGEGALERPFAHTLGFSNTSGHEIMSFFPIKNFTLKNCSLPYSPNNSRVKIFTDITDF